MSDDTAAFQRASDACGSFFVPRPASCYRVNGVVLHPGATITMEDRNTVVEPLSPSTPYVFEIAGKASAPSEFVTIRNGILWAPFNMAQGTTGIKIDFANHITLEDVVINGFYDNVFADNTQSLYLRHVSSNGGLHSNLWHQQSGGAAPYYGGPLYIEQSAFDSCKCSAASVWVQDIASVNLTDSEVVGVASGQGFHANSFNGGSGSEPNYPAGIHIHGDTFDTIAGEPISIQNYIKSDIQGTWISGGRTMNTPCIEIGNNDRDISITETHAYWCGTDGLLIDGATGVKVSNSSFSGTPNIGIHNLDGVRSFFSGNTCDDQRFDGNGAASQSYCVYEERGASNNTYIRNDATGTLHGNVYYGRSSAVVVP